MKYFPGAMLGAALKQFWRHPATISYPAGKLEIDPHYRGRINFNSDNCNGCGLCLADCPTQALTLRISGLSEKMDYQCSLDTGCCIFCAQCVDSCDKGCFNYTPNIELAALRKEELEWKL